MKLIALVLASILMVSCAGRYVPQDGLHFKVSQDPSLAATRASMVCVTPQSHQSRPMFCLTGSAPPDPFANWDVGFYPGNDYTGITFGPYRENVPVAFHPSLQKCLGASMHNLVADAASLAAAVQAGYNQWKSSNGSAQMEELLGSYAAGEIGAIAFIAGTVDILGVATVGLLIVGTGLTIYSLVAIAECEINGVSIGYKGSTA